jgi:hypothetical protein
MRAWFLTLITTAVLGLTLAAPSPTKVAADDDYWDGYWSWYDNTYRPYYYRQYRGRPRWNDGTVYDRWDGRYDGRYYYPSTRYYGTPRFGYREVPGGGQVRVGPLRFGWW